MYCLVFMGHFDLLAMTFLVTTSSIVSFNYAAFSQDCRRHYGAVLVCLTVAWKQSTKIENFKGFALREKTHFVWPRFQSMLCFSSVIMRVLSIVLLCKNHLHYRSHLAIIGSLFYVFSLHSVMVASSLCSDALCEQ